MCKEGWYVGLGQEGGCLHESGENCLKCLIRGRNKKEGRGNKGFKRGGKLGQGVGALKSEETGTPLRTMKDNF